jgi:hypothetical protein
VKCSSCQLLRINGLVCHETGCPEAHRSETRECRWCGAPFQPECKRERYCSVQCYAIDNSLPYDDDADYGILPHSDAVW